MGHYPCHRTNGGNLSRHPRVGGQAADNSRHRQKSPLRRCANAAAPGLRGPARGRPARQPGQDDCLRDRHPV